MSVLFKHDHHGCIALLGKFLNQVPELELRITGSIFLEMHGLSLPRPNAYIL